MSVTVATRTDQFPSVLRAAHVAGRPLVLHCGIHTKANASATGVVRSADGLATPTLHLRPAYGAEVTIDAYNGLAGVDAGMTLSSVARILARRGFVLPLARPLPPVSWGVACAAVPFVVDACVQRAQGLTLSGDAWRSPSAPRAAAGPSMLGALCTRPPLAVATSVHVRVVAAARSVVEHHACGDVSAAARRVTAELDDGRALSVDAFGPHVMVLRATSGTASSPDSTPNAFAHRGSGRRGVFWSSVSLVPGDHAAIAEALAAGARVAALPFMGRIAALWRRREQVLLADVHVAARQVVSALTAACDGGVR